MFSAKMIATCMLLNIQDVKIRAFILLLDRRYKLKANKNT